MHRALIREVGEDPDLTEQRCRRQLAAGYGRAESELVKSKLAF